MKPKGVLVHRTCAGPFAGHCIAILLLASLVGCSSYRHCQWREGDQTVNDSQDYSLRFIEADDEGWFWDRSQADEVMQLIRDKVTERNTIVVTFVHGWHHSAQCCDGNVEGFRQTLATLREKLDADPGSRFNIVGVYIGWRGQSLAMPFNYLTFWGRKAAAERVGQNDLQEFIVRLQALYLEHRPDAREPQAVAATPGEHTFLGLVTMGHSFGAQVLLKAVTGTLESQLQGLNRHPAYLRDAIAATPDPEQAYTLSGIGDLIVLVNPAVEASQYHRLHILSRGLNYSRYQTPLILTVSAENDRSRHRLFTFGRVLGEFFTGKPRKDDDVERIVERQALGVYRGHVTHKLVPTDTEVELISTEIVGDKRDCRNQQPCKVDWYEWSAPPTVTRPNSLVPNEDRKLRTFDFSRDVVFSNVELAALTREDIEALGEDPTEYAAAQPYQPFIVARASKQIIDDHNGVFTQPFLDFLVPYITYIELKSLLNVDRKRQRRDEVMQEAK